MRMFALAVLRQSDEDVTDVFVFPDETLLQKSDRLIRYRNSPEIVEALDRYLLTGELPAGEFYLRPPA